jgi:hypothetical protein
MKADPAAAAAPGAIAQVIDKVTKEYNRTLTKKLLMIDALLLYCVATGVVQVFIKNIKVKLLSNNNC